MSLAKFFGTISKIVPGNPLAGKEEAIARLDADKIYVENVRSILGVSTWRARQICETAVRQGLFQRHVEVVCPDDVVAASAPTESELPEVVRCWIEKDGELEEVEIVTSALPKTTFYRFMNK